MADSDKKAYATAIKCLMDAPSKGQTGAKSRWEDLASLHQQQNTKIHGVGQFLPWHRYFLHVQETVLRTECGYNGPLPWWDETKDAGRFEQSPVFDSRYLGSARVKTNNGLGACVTDGLFANVELNIGPGNNNQPHCLSRAVDNSLSRELTNNFIAACNSHSNYADMLNCAFPG
jgi:tyrosinase